MGKFVLSGLRAVGHDVIWLDDRFPRQSTEDIEWLREAGEQGWIVITQDLRIRVRANELQALYDARVRCFMLGGAQLTGQQTLDRLLAAWRRIENICNERSGPFLYRVTANGKVERRDRPEDWARLTSSYRS